MILLRATKTACTAFLVAGATLLSGCIEQRSAEELKDSLVFGFEGTFHTFDPARQVYAQETQIMAQVLEGLVRWNRDLEIEPALAESWELSEDAMQWRFILREGVEFHDGTPFDAHAVKWHFERIMDPETASTRRTQLDGVDNIELVNDYEIVFNLNEPDATLIYRLGSAFASIPSPTAYERMGSGIGTNPVGTGPFEFVEWRPDVHIRFKRNENYWEPDEYLLERLELRPVRENTTRLILLEQGVLDIAHVAFPHVQVADESDEVRLQTTPALNIRYIGMNTGKPPFDDVRVRQAANYAINKEDMIEYSFFGVGEPARGPVPSVVDGHNPDTHPYTYDPERARELLAEAGYPDGVDVVMWTHESGLYRTAADAVADYLRRVGIRVSIRLYDNAAYSSKFDEYITRGGDRYPTRDGVFDMFLGGWSGGETAFGYLDYLFRSDSYSNNTFYANSEVDRLLQGSRAVVDTEERNEYYRRVQEIVVEEAPWIFAFHGQENIGYNSRVKNYQIHPAGRIMLQGVYVEDNEE